MRRSRRSRLRFGSRASLVHSCACGCGLAKSENILWRPDVRAARDCIRAAFKASVGVWRSLVAHTLGVRVVAGSNPATPTKIKKSFRDLCSVLTAGVRRSSMDFGTLIFTKPERAISDVRYAEERGFSHAWIPDSHMIWGDTYACMALAAVNTKKIKLGTGVAIASNRIPPVTVHSIATINQLAPGRVILGFGTGHTGRRVMGLPPVKQAEFREQVRVIHDLLHDGEATYHTEGLSRKIKYLHRDRRFINLDDRIPFYVAANGPKTLALAGEFGDGVITTGITEPDRVAAVRKKIAAAASKAGGSAHKMPTAQLTHVCILRPGEKLDSPRVKAMTGHWVMASFHAIAAGYAGASYLPEDGRRVYSGYEQYVAAIKTPAAERYPEPHIGPCTYGAPDEREYATPAAIPASTMIGAKEELVERLRAMERAGLSQMFINPPMDGYNDCIDEISRDVITRR